MSVFMAEHFLTQSYTHNLSFLWNTEVLCQTFAARMDDCHCKLSFFNIDNSGYVSDFELQELFREASFNIPGYKIREIVEKFMEGDTNKDEKISFEEFVAVSLTMSFCLILKCW